MARDAGPKSARPGAECGDEKCPFHGSVRVRGRLLVGRVASAKMANTVVVERELLKRVPKYERYARSRRRVSAHCPPCLQVKVGDLVRIGECRPLAKTVHHVVIERVRPGVD
ncbi:MAG: 30S ribosomal protein S17 [Candidatus Brockarchaeota archaeon]|nr:30S ribosomal protein S17 [Candidatus Brockarchaeota archaeon]